LSTFLSTAMMFLKSPGVMPCTTSCHSCRMLTLLSVTCTTILACSEYHASQKSRAGDKERVC
jgi:hypothetical protein